ncbi:MAG TPA: hypothetical protein VLA61_04230 [Ideonella sp.]|uniref:hypothetical protein n=1 Tax=Ideonella sp. TaxID=1929293 RepID=UPI002B911D9C|nr:hypothetical protein [Ideonella sp.]HSI47447.1 hypothetical protein [Ideonella sp.]
MNFSSIGGGAGMSAYINALLAKANGTAGTTDADSSGTAAATPTTAAAKAAVAASLASAAHSFKSTSAQHKLDQKQTALATDMRAAMAKAGVKLSGSVAFSVDAKGGLTVEGSDKDKAAVTAFLKADASKPGFSSRLGALSTEASALSATIRQSAAISQAARYAGASGNVMAMYTSLLKQQDATPATFALSAANSSLTYAGVLSSTA